MVSALYEFDGHKQTVALQTCRLQESASQTAEPHVALHFHGAVEFLFVENGRYRAWVDGNTFTLRKGDILFVDSHLPHSYESLGEAIVHFVSLSESFFEGLHFPRKIPRVLRAEQKNNFLFRLFKEATEGWENVSEQYKLGFAYSLCGALLRSYPLQFPNEQPHEERFTDVLKYIEEHFRETLTLDDLTHRFGYSKSYFSRTFNKVTGVNLREFLNRCRINEALRMKEANPSIPWVHITANVGFESWSTFARAYKRYCGNNVVDENTTK